MVSAVPQHTLPGLLDPEIRNRAPFLDLASFETSPITGIHLWFDRSVTDCPHVALLGREMQWIFAKHVQNLQNSPERSPQSQPGSYLGLVVSASRGLTSRTREEIIGMALDAVHDVFPASREARVIRGVVIREPRATFSPCPGAEALRPPARTPIQGLYLAGDWTRTRWPATMEGAVRGGYLAAEAILRDDGQEASLLCPEMPPDTLPRLLGL